MYGFLFFEGKCKAIGVVVNRVIGDFFPGEG